MKIISRDKLYEFCGQHADASGRVKAWEAEVEEAQWKNPHELKERFPSASLLGDRKVVFNIGGNRYRMICKIAYNTGTISVSWIGTHAEYDRL